MKHGKGGLYATDFSLCILEEGSEGNFVAKEVLGSLDILYLLWQEKKPSTLEVRTPTQQEETAQSFGMIQWLTPPPTHWTGEETAFLGMAFD